MNITFIGIGNVGYALANNLSLIGHDIYIGTEDKNSESVKKALFKNKNMIALPTQKAINTSRFVFLAVPFKAVTSILSAFNFNGKTIIDCTNPVGTGITHGLDSKQSGSEFIQSLLPNSKVIKAFTIYGFENFIDNAYNNYDHIKPAMLIAGNDNSSKDELASLIEALNWETVDTGNLDQALHLEHMTLLWIKMARVQGIGSDFVWARLTR